MTSERIFGTDGIRGRAGEGWLSREGVSAVGRAIGVVLTRGRPSAGKVLLGHDGRRSGPMLETGLSCGLRSAGLEVKSCGLISTPGLALITRLEGFDLGVMISASHNPSNDNGIKIFTGEGDKLSEEVELEIEAYLRENAEPHLEGPAPELDRELEMSYLTYLVDRAANGLKLDGKTIVIDCANGGGSRIAPRVLGRLGAQIHPIFAEPDGENINRGCGSTHPTALQSEVRRLEADLGIALDGDGDRCILVDENGAIVHGDGILTVLTRHFASRGELRDPRIIATVMSNRGLHRALREVGVTVVTVGVGDRAVVESLRQECLSLGGEQSGHIVFGSDHFHIGDGIYTALRVLRVICESGKPLSELAAPYRPFPQVLLNVPVASKPKLSDLPDAARAVKRVEEELGSDGRVLLRYSGTEPLMRVMVEGPDLDQIQAQAQSIADLISAQLGEACDQ